MNLSVSRGACVGAKNDDLKIAQSKSSKKSGEIFTGLAKENDLCLWPVLGSIYGTMLVEMLNFLTSKFSAHLRSGAESIWHYTRHDTNSDCQVISAPPCIKFTDSILTLIKNITMFSTRAQNWKKNLLCWTTDF